MTPPLSTIDPPAAASPHDVGLMPRPERTPVVRSVGRLARVRTAVMCLGDVAAVLAADALARLVSGSPAGFSLRVALLQAAGMVALFALAGHYGTRPGRIGAGALATSARQVVMPLIVGALVLSLLVAEASNPAAVGLPSPLAIGLMLGAALCLVPAVRVVSRSAIGGGAAQERAVIVGSGQVAGLIRDKLADHPEYGIEVVGFVDDIDGPGVPGMRRLGGRADLAQACHLAGASRVLVAYSNAGHDEMLALLRSVRHAEVNISIVPRYFEVFPAHAQLDDLEGIPVVTLPPVRLGRGARITKRIFDVALAGTALVMLAPVMAVIAVAIRLDSPGPAFFRQDRRGRNGSVMRIVKFRTMCERAEERRGELFAHSDVDGPLHKVRSGRDPRVTRIGHHLRRTSLDELPQLWNVVRGDMSLVGPRPFVLDEADRITGWASRRLEAAPGVTGLWQALGRSDLSYEEMIKLDYLYVTNWSLWWDIRILIRTVRVVLGRRGAY